MRLRSPSPSRLLAGIGALLLAGGLTAGGALPAAAAPSSGVLTYVALGDSYAAGQATNCTHTPSSYPLRLDALREVKLLRDVTCAAADTSTVRTSQLSALNPGVKLVTVTVGANDLDVAGLEVICTSDPTACPAAIAARQAQLPALLGNLTATLTAVAAAAPNATILVTGYPALFSTGPIADAEAALNATIQSAVAAAHLATGADIRFVDVQFAGHTVDSADPWFVLAGPDIFHPTAEGDAAFADAIAAAI
jgi:lysophospholipase L1-like esterase